MYGSGEALYGERLYTEEEEAVYVINIHDRTVQWESRKTSCSIINIYIYIIFLKWLDYRLKYTDVVCNLLNDVTIMLLYRYKITSI